MFTTDMKEAGTQEINLPGINYETMEQITQYIYTGKMRISIESAQNILIAANFLQMVDLVDLCGKYVIKHIDAANCIEMRELLRKTNCSEEIVGKATDYIKSKYYYVHKKDSFLRLDINDVVDLLSSTELCCLSEEDVVHGAVRWLGADPDRKEYYQQLFNCIRRPLLSDAFKIENIYRNPLFGKLTVTGKPSDTPRETKTSLLALSGKNVSSLQFYDSIAKEWKNIMDLATKPYKLIAANSDYVFLAGPVQNEFGCFFFDVVNLKTRKLTHLPLLQHEEQNIRPITMILVQSKLYFFTIKESLVNGHTMYTHILDTNANHWVIGTEHVFTRPNPCFSVIDQYIYVYETFERRHTILHKLDTVTENWTYLPNQGLLVNYHMITKFREKVYTAKIKESWNRFLVHDLITNENKLLKPMSQSVSKLTALLATSDGIYALSNNRVEYYDVVTENWQHDEEMSIKLKYSLFTTVPILNCL